MGRPSLTYTELMRAVVALSPTSLFGSGMAPALWSAAIRYGIDPAAIVTQSAYETGWGQFTRLTKPWHYNTCGLKVRELSSVMTVLGITTSEHVLCHQQFSSWEEGAEAHAQHLRAYCQVEFANLIVDPRYAIVQSINTSTGRPPSVHLADLDPWAGAAGYGTRLEQVANRLLQVGGGQ